MLNSPTLCQEFVDQARHPARLTHPGILLYHYMDDILLTAPRDTERDGLFYSYGAIKET